MKIDILDFFLLMNFFFFQILLGKGGENIKRLNHKSGCLVTISKDYKGEHMNEKTVIITGKPDKVEAVKKEIDEIVAQVGSPLIFRNLLIKKINY